MVNRLTFLFFFGLVITFHFPIMVEAISTSDATITAEYTTFTLTHSEKNETESNCTSTSESATTLPCPAITSAVTDTTMTSPSNTEVTTDPESMSTGELTTHITDSFTTKAELSTNTISTDRPLPNETFTAEQNTPSPVTSLTTTKKNTIAGNPLSVSYPLRDHFMYISATLSIDLGNYNDSLEPALIAQFIAEMGSLLEKTTGFAGIQVKRVFSNIVSHRMKRADNKDVTIDYAVLLIGDTDLNETIQTIPDSPRNISLLGDNTFLIEWKQLGHAINTTMEALQMNVCSVFNDVETCRAGFSYRRDSVNIICSHVCLKVAKCGANGVCYFDEIVNDAMCRCKESDDRYYTGTDCGVEAYKLALPPGAVIGISAGLGGALLFVILVLVVRIWKINRKSVGKPERNSFDREMTTWECNPNSDDRGITEERRHDFNARHYRGSQDQDHLAGPTHMYPYNSQTEAICIKPGSSLSNLTFPEYKFEISRPKLVQGRNGRY